MLGWTWLKAVSVPSMAVVKLLNSILIYPLCCKFKIFPLVLHFLQCWCQMSSVCQVVAVPMEYLARQALLPLPFPHSPPTRGPRPLLCYPRPILARCLLAVYLQTLTKVFKYLEWIFVVYFKNLYWLQAFNFCTDRSLFFLIPLIDTKLFW